MRYKRLIWILLIVLIIGVVSAQSGSPHTIYGYVNSDGEPYPGVNVAVQNTRTGESWSDTTTGDGLWIVQLANLPSGYSDGDLITITATLDDQNSTTITVDTSVEPPRQKADNITLKTFEPTSNSPPDATYDLNSAGNTIDWILTDNYSPGYYMVNRNGEAYVYWNTWINNTSLNIPVDTSSAGSFNYMIYFNDSAGNDGTSDLVIITIKDSPEATPQQGSDNDNGGISGGSGGYRSPPSQIQTDTNGTVLSNVAIASSDEGVVVTISEGTTALDAYGKPLKHIEIIPISLPGTIAAYKITPDGVTFFPPVELKIKYEPSEVIESDLVVKMYKDKKWSLLETTVEQPKYSISVSIGHSGIFALFSERIPTTTETETSTVTQSPIPPKSTPTFTPIPSPRWQIPGFEATFTIVVIFAVAYLIRRR